jgi:putative transposase
MIDQIQQRTQASIRIVCQVLGLPRSSYFHAAKPTPSQLDDQQMTAHITAILTRHRRRYGYRRIGDELADQGIRCGPGRIRRLMRQAGLRAIQPRSFVPRTSDGKANLPSPNRLADQPPPEQADQVWTGDITYIPTTHGWLYLAVVIDLCSRKIIGWKLGRNLRAELVVAALQQAIECRRPVTGTIFHSDRGSQYASGAFRALLAAAGILQSSPAEPILTTTPGPNPSWEHSNGKCSKTDASRTQKMPTANSSSSTRATTTPNANTPPWATSPPINLKPNYSTQNKTQTGP